MNASDRAAADLPPPKMDAAGFSEPAVATTLPSYTVPYPRRPQI
jgi:hypothetical protein